MPKEKPSVETNWTPNVEPNKCWNTEKGMQGHRPFFLWSSKHWGLKELSNPDTVLNRCLYYFTTTVRNSQRWVRHTWVWFEPRNQLVWRPSTRQNLVGKWTPGFIFCERAAAGTGDTVILLSALWQCDFLLVGPSLIIDLWNNFLWSYYQVWTVIVLDFFSWVREHEKLLIGT